MRHRRQQKLENFQKKTLSHSSELHGGTDSMIDNTYDYY